MDDVARQLYTLPPEEFVAARDEAARTTRDRSRAAEIVKMRRPTVAAWLVNLLAIKRPELLVELADLAGMLRAAQRELRGAELRELSTQRRATVAALVAEARRLALEVKPRAGNLPLAEVESTLQAALAEPEAADAVRSGRLVRAIEYAGFGEVPRPQLRLVTSADLPGEERDGQQTVDVAEELAAARTAETAARRALEEASAAEQEAGRALAETEKALAELEQRRAVADEEVGRRKLARKAAERAMTEARRRVGAAEAAAEAAEHD